LLHNKTPVIGAKDPRTEKDHRQEISPSLSGMKFEYTSGECSYWNPDHESTSKMFLQEHWTCFAHTFLLCTAIHD